jgi:hypothetical protein
MRTKKPDTKQPWHEFNGLLWIWGSDLVAAPSQSLRDADQRTLAKAIRRTFKKTHPTYQRMVQRRYVEVYRVPVAEAVVAVIAGYSSPLAAMRAGVIRRRKRIGFIGERTP